MQSYKWKFRFYEQLRVRFKAALIIYNALQFIVII